MLFPSPVVAIIERAFSPLANINYIPYKGGEKSESKISPTEICSSCWEHFKSPVLAMYSNSNIDLPCSESCLQDALNDKHLCTPPPLHSITQRL